MKCIKIVIIGSNTTLDNGESAITSVAIKELKKLFPKSIFIVGSTNKEIDIERWRKMLPYESPDIYVAGGINSHRIPRSIRAASVILRYIPECWNADLCIDISGDGYSDVTQSGRLSTLTHSIQLLIGILLRKPVVVYAQSIGPFETVPTRFLARFVLNKVSLIIVRESISENYLNINRISRPDVVLTSDSAFLLDPISPIEAKSILAKEGVDVENRPIFGVAMSQIIHRWMFPDCRDSRRKYELYTDTMARVADYLVERFDSTVILLSQCIGKFARHDDRIAAMETYRKVVHPDRVKVILGQYTPSELKGVIGCCQLMVSSKMHSAIAAVTMLVPTVVLAYSYKTQGIFGRKLGMTHLIVDVRHSNSKTLFEEITEKIDHAWSSRKRISNVLHEKVNIEKKQAIRSAILAAGLIAD